MAGETRLRARKWQPNVSAMCPSGQIWGSRQGLTAGRRAGKWQPAAHLAPSRGQHGPRGQRIGQLLGEETSSRRCSRHEKMALHEGVWSPHFDGLKSKTVDYSLSNCCSKRRPLPNACSLEKSKIYNIIFRRLQSFKLHFRAFGRGRRLEKVGVWNKSAVLNAEVFQEAVRLEEPCVWKRWLF